MRTGNGRQSEELRFDARTVIVTGAGGDPSLGRAHALLLAARGANVVVNDIGVSSAPGYEGVASADAVAAEIRATGGSAVASTHSVADEDGAAALVDLALSQFGSVDIVINNAGVSIAAPFDVMTPGDFRRHIDVNLMGAYYVAHAAWPHMKARRYGRIINTTSSAMTGFSGQAAYAASKGGLWSLTRALAAEGAAYGIKTNAVSPGAYTRMVKAMLEEDSPFLEQTRVHLPPELVSPVVAYLAHETCPVSGECIDAVGGAVQRTFIGRTPGFADPEVTIEMTQERWAEVMAETGADVIGLASHDTAEWKLKPYSGDGR